MKKCLVSAPADVLAVALDAAVFDVGVVVGFVDDAAVDVLSVVYVDLVAAAAAGGSIAALPAVGCVLFLVASVLVVVVEVEAFLVAAVFDLVTDARDILFVSAALDDWLPTSEVALYRKSRLKKYHLLKGMVTWVSAELLSPTETLANVP